MSKHASGPDGSVAQLVHFDLKSGNVLLQDKRFRVAKIADLGLSKYLLERSVLTNAYRVAHLAEGCQSLHLRQQ